LKTAHGILAEKESIDLWVRDKKRSRVAEDI